MALHEYLWYNQIVISGENLLIQSLRLDYIKSKNSSKWIRCIRVHDSCCLKKNGTVYIADPNFGALLRFFANKFWFPVSKSGDVRIYSPKELEAI